MRPILTTLVITGESHDISSYAAAMAAAVTITLGLGIWRGARRGLGAGRMLCLCVALGVAFLLGARVLAEALWAISSTDPSPQTPTLFNRYSLSGGVLGAVAAFGLLRPLLRLPWGAAADAIAPALLLGIAVMRLGCFAQGCCFGVESDAPWAVRFPAASLPGIYQLALHPETILSGPRPVHPVQLYEAAAAALAAGLAMYWTCAFHRQIPGIAGKSEAALQIGSRFAPGGAAWRAAILFGAVRIASDWVRVPLSFLAGQIAMGIDSALLVAGLVLCYRGSAAKTGS